MCQDCRDGEVIRHNRTPRDPLTGRNFDGHYDDVATCGCVEFYRSGTHHCSSHGGPSPQGEGLSTIVTRVPSSIHTYAIASVVSFLMLATVLSAPAPVRIKVSPQTLFAGQAINLTCYIPPHASNRQLRYGIENYTESRRDLQGDTDYPTHGPYLIQHIPCDATTAYCSVLRNDGTQVMVTARLLLAGCN